MIGDQDDDRLVPHAGALQLVDHETQQLIDESQLHQVPLVALGGQARVVQPEPVLDADDGRAQRLGPVVAGAGRIDLPRDVGGHQVGVVHRCPGAAVEVADHGEHLIDPGAPLLGGRQRQRGLEIGGLDDLDRPGLTGEPTPLAVDGGEPVADDRRHGGVGVHHHGVGHERAERAVGQRELTRAGIAVRAVVTVGWAQRFGAQRGDALPHPHVVRGSEQGEEALGMVPRGG